MGTLKKVGCHTYKSERNPASTLKDRFYRVDFTGYPSNHFSGCRLNEQLISFILGSSVQMVYPLAHNNTSVTPFHTILGCIRLVFVMANEKVSPSKIVCH